MAPVGVIPLPGGVAECSAIFHVTLYRQASPGETLEFGVPDQTTATLWCRFSLGSIVCGAALEDRGRRWSGFVLNGASVEISSHA